jgi:hypothetical protein
MSIVALVIAPLLVSDVKKEAKIEVKPTIESVTPVAETQPAAH